jgi:hypothetical protein
MWIAGVVLAGIFASYASAQNDKTQQQPLGDYARTVRKDKKPASVKQFDNDNIPVTDKLSVVGGGEASGDRKATADSGDKTQPAANDAQDAKAQTAANSGDDANANAGQDAAPTEKKADAKPTEIKPGESPGDRQKTFDGWKDRLVAQRAKLDLLGRELDVEQREYQLRAAAMYADAGNRMRNETAWDKEDADYKKKIDEKKKAVDAAKQELDDMEENARKAGVPSSVRE